MKETSLQSRGATLAHQLLDVCLSVRRGDRVWINTWEHTLELASHLGLECENRGCDVFTTVQLEDVWLHSIMKTPISLLDQLPERTAAILEKTDVYLYTLGPSNPVPWDKIPEKRRKLVTRWFLEDNNFVKGWKKIARKNLIRMLGIEATLATQATAKALDLNYEAWRNVMFDGCMADYHEISRRAKNLARKISGRGEVHVVTPYGTDFRFRLDDRPISDGYGLADEKTVREGRVVFVPAGGVEVSAMEQSGQGRIVFDAPILSLIREGRINRLSLEIEDGRIRRFSAKSNSAAFGRWLRAGGGDVDRFGFFGFGLNPKMLHGFTQDDKVLGGVTIGFGDNADKGGKNRAGGRGFWASMTKAHVTIDGIIIMKNGILLV